MLQNYYKDDMSTIHLCIYPDSLVELPAKGLFIRFTSWQ